jgi:hypothetical protein
LSLAAVLLAVGPSSGADEKQASSRTGATVFDAAFWKTWGDGNAEVSSYDLVFPRYGKPRQGLAVAIFVTEPFSDSLRVKADPGKHPASDVFPVMKLNLVEDFQTGVYDYNEQTSSFLALSTGKGRTEGTLSKISFSSQEWCGHAWLQALVGTDRLKLTEHSYFDGEADRQYELPLPGGGVSEEQLIFWARGMAAPRLSPGQSIQAPFLPSLQSSRHDHKSLQWTRVRLSRDAAKREIQSPAGRFRVEVFRSVTDAGFSRTFYVEADAPHRVVRWETSAGEHAELVASERLKYWELNRPGDESVLTRLGLKRRTSRTP